MDSNVGDYAAVAETPAFEYVEKLLSTTVTLWMGYSHSDPDFTFALRPFRFSHSFQIVAGDDPSLIELCRIRGITPIPLESYDQLPAFLKSLAQETGARSHNVTAFLGAGPKPNDPATLNPVGLAVTNRFLSDPLSRLPRTHLPRLLVNPGVVLRGQERHLDPEELFQMWTATPVPGVGRRKAIVAPPATGKTVLLSRFAQWLRGQFQPDGGASPRHARLFPIVVFLTADNLSETVSRDKPFWEQVERWAQGPIAGYHAAETRGLLDPWLEKGAVYLLFDGLDEFGARRRGELEDLLWHLSELVSEKGITVLLTCREVFWNQQVRPSDKASWEEIGILPFTPEEVERVVPYPGLGRFAYDKDGKPKRGVLNYQLVSFVLVLKAEGQSPESFESRYELYLNWARLTAEKCSKRFASDVPPEEWIGLFKSTALELLRQKLLSVPLPGLRERRSIPYYQCAATGILTPSADGRDVKFYHESINEFFVSWILVDDCRKVLGPAISADALSDLPLAQVDLDFLQTSLHGFLHEKLGSGYVRDMMKAVERPGFPTGDDRTINLMRNLVEDVGITFEGGRDTRDVVDWLLGLMRRSELSFVIRYNAARALERVHPWAPKPYFDYMSDWGDRDWRKERNQARVEKLCPWAIRGYYKRKGKDKEGKEREEIVGRQPGRWPPLLVLRSTPADPDLQKYVSKELAGMLIDLLQRLPGEPPPKPGNEPRSIDWLLINYSHAWVRWYCPDHHDLLKAVQDLAKENEACMETLENLFEWVGHKGFRNG